MGRRIGDIFNKTIRTIGSYKAGIILLTIIVIIRGTILSLADCIKDIVQESINLCNDLDGSMEYCKESLARIKERDKHEEA